MVNVSDVIWKGTADLVYLMMKVSTECHELNVQFTFSSVASPF